MLAHKNFVILEVLSDCIPTVSNFRKKQQSLISEKRLKIIVKDVYYIMFLLWKYFFLKNKVKTEI